MAAFNHAIQNSAASLRRWPALHKPLRWLRRTLWPAMVDARLEFSRRLNAGNTSKGPACKVFSVYQALRTGDPKLNGRIVLEDQGCPQVQLDAPMVVGGYLQHKQQPWPILWSEHPRVQLISESLALMLDRKTICLEAAYQYPRVFTDPAWNIRNLPPPVRLEGAWTSIVSRWVPTRSKEFPIPNHSHWLMDALPRLALLPEFPPETRILVPDPLAAYQKEALSMLGLWDRCRPTPEHHLEVERYFFSSPTAMLTAYDPYGMEFLRKTFLPKRDQSYHGPKRIFIQKKSDFRSPLNSAELEAFATARGWTVMDVAKLTFTQELQLFYEAEAICGLFGSGFTNTIFCQPGCKVLHVGPTCFGQDGYMDWISQCVPYKLHSIYIPSDYSRRYTVDLKLFEEHLRKLETA